MHPTKGVAPKGVTAGSPHCRLWNGDQRELDLPGHRNRRGRRRRVPARHLAGNDAAQSGHVAPLGCRAPARRRSRVQRGRGPARTADVHGGLHAIADLHRLLPQLCFGVESAPDGLCVRRSLGHRHNRLARDPRRCLGDLRRHRGRLPGRDTDADEELDPPGVRDRALLHRRSHQHGHPFADGGPLDVRRSGLPALCRVRGLRGITSPSASRSARVSALPSSRSRLGRAGRGDDASSPAAW